MKNHSTFILIPSRYVQIYGCLADDAIKVFQLTEKLINEWKYTNSWSEICFISNENLGSLYYVDEKAELCYWKTTDPKVRKIVTDYEGKIQEISTYA